MVPIYADIPADVMKLVQVAKALHGQPLKEIVREALMEWLKVRGLDKLPSAGKPRH